jgi:hypothetical protein
MQLSVIGKRSRLICPTLHYAFEDEPPQISIRKTAKERETGI